MAGYSSSQLISGNEEPKECPSEVLATSTDSKPEPELEEGVGSSSNIGGAMVMNVHSIYSLQKHQQSNLTSSDKLQW